MRAGVMTLKTMKIQTKRKNTMKPKLYTDGACRGNPGKGACAWVLAYGSDVLFQQSMYIGLCTNNIAEYCAVLYGLISLTPSDVEKITVVSDSELLINQMNGTYQCNNENLKFYNVQIKELIKTHYTAVNFEHVNRTDTYISLCDKLCNQTLDKYK